MCASPAGNTRSGTAPPPARAGGGHALSGTSSSWHARRGAGHARTRLLAGDRRERRPPRGCIGSGRCIPRSAGRAIPSATALDLISPARHRGGREPRRARARIATPERIEAVAEHLLAGEFETEHPGQAPLVAPHCRSTGTPSSRSSTQAVPPGGRRPPVPVCGSAPVASVCASAASSRPALLHCSLCDTEWHCRACMLQLQQHDRPGLLRNRGAGKSSRRGLRRLPHYLKQCT